MHITAENFWSRDFAASVLARRADLPVLPYKELLSLETVRQLTGLPLHEILTEFDCLTMPNEMTVVHPETVIEYQKSIMLYALQDLMIDENAALQMLQQEQQNSVTAKAA